MTIQSPCVRICVVDGPTGLCLGCGRTLPEIARWGSMQEEERAQIMRELKARMLAKGIVGSELTNPPR